MTWCRDVKVLMSARQTRVKYVLDSNAFPCFADGCLVYWDLRNALNVCKPRILVVLVYSGAPGKSNRAQESVWIQNDYGFYPGLPLVWQNVKSAVLIRALIVMWILSPILILEGGNPLMGCLFCVAYALIWLCKANRKAAFLTEAFS